MDAVQQFRLSGDISPTAIAAQADNYDPTNLATSTTLRLTLTGDQTITGIVGGVDGRILILHNIDTVDTLTLADDVTSTAANRFYLSGSTNLAVAPEQSVILRYDATSSRWRDVAYTGEGKAAIPFIIGDGSTAITTGLKYGFRVPFACTIKGVSMGIDPSGSIVVDIWKDTHVNYPPLDADSITASAVPTITTDTDMEDVTLTGWTTAIAAGDWLYFNVDSVTTATVCMVNLDVDKT